MISIIKIFRFLHAATKGAQRPIAGRAMCILLAFPIVAAAYAPVLLATAGMFS